MEDNSLDIYTNRLSYEVIGAAIEAHKALGAGLLEAIYQNAMCVELADRKIPFEKEKPISVYYKNQLVGDYRIDILVDKRIVVELKSVEKISPVHQSQIMTYLKISGCRLGLLMNFNVKMMKQGITRVAL
jgi:GxxExxY protein